MAKLSKRAAAIAAKIDRNKLYPVEEALTLVKETATAKFDESIDVAVQLGIDPVNPTSWFVVPWYCLLVQVNLYVWLFCSRR